MAPLRFTAEVIEWRGPAPFFYAVLPAEAGAAVAAVKRAASYGWGVIPVTATIAGVTFTTSLFPRDGTYLLPLKNAVRSKIGGSVGDTLAVTMRVGGDAEQATQASVTPKKKAEATPKRLSSGRDFARLVRLAKKRGLPGVVEGTTYDGVPALRVGDRPFASIKPEGLMVLHCPLDLKDMLLTVAPEIYFETPHFKGWPGLLVRLAAIGDAELTDRLEDAWRFKAPKRLVAALPPSP